MTVQFHGQAHAPIDASGAVRLIGKGPMEYQLCRFPPSNPAQAFLDAKRVILLGGNEKGCLPQARAVGRFGCQLFGLLMVGVVSKNGLEQPFGGPIVEIGQAFKYIRSHGYPATRRGEPALGASGPDVSNRLIWPGMVLALRRP